MLLEPAKSGLAAISGVTLALPQRSQAALSNDKMNKIDNKWVEVKRCMPQDGPNTVLVTTYALGCTSNASHPVCSPVPSERECDGIGADMYPAGGDASSRKRQEGLVLQSAMH